MRTKVALTIVAMFALAVAVGCTPPETKKPNPKPVVVKAECVLEGDWGFEADGDETTKRSLTLTFAEDLGGGAIATGTLNVGTRDPDACTFEATASDVDTIQDGGSSTVKWTYGNANVDCGVKFVDDCEALEFSCPNDVFQITRE